MAVGFVLIDAIGKTKEVAKAISKLDQVLEKCYITGEISKFDDEKRTFEYTPIKEEKALDDSPTYTIIIGIDTNSNKELHEFVAEKIAPIAGVRYTKALALP